MYYIAGRIDAEQTLTDLRDTLATRNKLALSDFHPRTPHLTFLNQIKLPTHQEPEVHETIEQHNPASIPVTVTGISVWPSIETPRYVSLTVNAPIKNYQNEFSIAISQSNGELLTDPPKPHITLFKCERPGDVSDLSKTELAKLEEKDFDFQTHIPYIDLLSSSMTENTDTQSTTSSFPQQYTD